MKSRTRSRKAASIGSNQSLKSDTASSTSGCTASRFVVRLVMAWSPARRANAGFDWVGQSGDYATPNSNQPCDSTIITKLRQVDVLVSQGQSVADAVRSIGVTEVTYYRWRQEYGGLKTEQIRRLKELETENARLRRAVADLTLDKLILKEAAAGNY